MAHQQTNPTTSLGSNPTSTMEIELERRLVACCGGNAASGRLGREPAPRADWILTDHDDRHE